MQYEKKLIEVGGSQGLILPLDLCKYLGLTIGDTLIIQDDKGKKGKFISLWKKSKEVVKK